MFQSIRRSTVAVTVLLAACAAGDAAEQTLNPGANLVAALTSAQPGDIINLTAGDHGSVDITGVVKSGYVTVRSAPGGGLAQIILRTSINDKWTTPTARYLIFTNLQIGGVTSEALQDVQFRNNRFVGAAEMRTLKGTTSARIVFDGNVFTDVDTKRKPARPGILTPVWDGRLTVRGYGNTAPVGITITNNQFTNTSRLTGDADGIQVIGSAYGVEIGPGNRFVGLRQDPEPSRNHTDPIQLYGSSHSRIIGNYFQDCSTGIMSPDAGGADSETIVNNVFIMDEYAKAISAGGWYGQSLIEHNTFIGLNPSLHGAIFIGGGKANLKYLDGVFIVRNNVMPKVVITDGIAVHQTYNLALANLPAGNGNVTGAATHVGGAFPTTWAGAQLAAGSLGKGVASDGLDMGATSFGTTGQANRAPVASPQSVTTTAGVARTINLSAVDPDGDALTFAIATPPAHGTLSGTGATRTYVPTAGYIGSDSFAFTAHDGTIASGLATVTITVAAPPWTGANIGSVGVPGSAVWAGSTVTVRGAGADMWGTTDACFFDYQTLTGDGSITAKVASFTGWTAGNAKACLMIRQDLTPGSVNARSLVTGNWGTRFHYRATANGTTGSVTGSPTATAPIWLRLERVGTVLTGYTSMDGVTWTRTGSANFPNLPAQVLIGPAVTSISTSQAATAVFEQVTIVRAPAAGG